MYKSPDDNFREEQQTHRLEVARKFLSAKGLQNLAPRYSDKLFSTLLEVLLSGSRTRLFIRDLGRELGQVELQRLQKSQSLGTKRFTQMSQYFDPSRQVLFGRD